MPGATLHSNPGFLHMLHAKIPAAIQSLMVMLALLKACLSAPGVAGRLLFDGHEAVLIGQFKSACRLFGRVTTLW